MSGFSRRPALPVALALSLSLGLAASAAEEPYAGAAMPRPCRLPFGMLQWSPAGIFAGDAGCGIWSMLSFDFLDEAPPTTVREEFNPAVPQFLNRGRAKLAALDSPAHARWARADGALAGEMAVSWRSGIGLWRWSDEKPRNATSGGRRPASVWIAFGYSSVMGLRCQDGVLAGSAFTANFCGSKQEPAVEHFAVRFSKPPAEIKPIAIEATRKNEKVAEAQGIALRFDFGTTPELAMKVGVSWVGQEKALKNLDAEIPDWDLPRVAADGKKIWDGFLARVDTSGAPAWLRRHLTTTLMDAICWPYVFTDVDGEYMGFDVKPHRAALRASSTLGVAPAGLVGGKLVPAVGHRYHQFSSWDTKYAQQPLLAVLYPEIASDICQTFVDQARTGGGGFARWSIAYRETGVMEGDPSSIMIAHSHALGARDFDVDAALEVMERVATTPGVQSSPGFLSRPALRPYLQKGIAAPNEKDSGLSGTGGKSGSQTCDYAIADFAISRLALAKGKKDLADRLLRQAQHWKAIIDPQTKQFGARFSYSESDHIRSQWHVPHNVGGLVAMMGGPQAALKHWNAHFPHLGNEDNHYAPWAPNGFGTPWVAQASQRMIFMNQFTSHRRLGRWNWKWKPGDALEPAELFYNRPGSNDLGAMTSMAFWLAVGVFPAIPGLDGLSVGAPLAPRIVLHRGPNGSLTVAARDASPDACYVQSLTVNGKPHASSWIPGELLHAKDNVLEFQMGRAPNESWGNSPPPPSFDAEPWYQSQKAQ